MKRQRRVVKGKMRQSGVPSHLLFFIPRNFPKFLFDENYFSARKRLQRTNPSSPASVNLGNRRFDRGGSSRRQRPGREARTPLGYQSSHAHSNSDIPALPTSRWRVPSTGTCETARDPTSTHPVERRTPVLGGPKTRGTDGQDTPVVRHRATSLKPFRR